MTDERQPDVLFESWLKDTDPTPLDARPSVASVMTRVPQTRQRGRWWPLPTFHRMARARTAMPPDATEYQPSSIPTAKGHAPTVRRTQTMLSPIKAIAAGAIVFAVGGAFLIAQPFGQQRSVPGAEQGAEPAAPVEVTATHRDTTCEGDVSSEVEGRVVRVSGYTCTVDNEWSDPRLQGTETYISNYVDQVDSGLTIGQYVHNIVTDDGAWRMRPQFRFDSAGPFGDAGPENFSGTWVLDGEGAHEGLSAVLVKDGNDLAGFIVESDLLPLPPEEGSAK